LVPAVEHFRYVLCLGALNRLRAYIPESPRLEKEIRHYLRKLREARIRRDILRYHGHSGDREIREVLQFLRHHPASLIPYPFREETLSRLVPVKRGDDGAPSVFHGGREVHFPRDWTDEKVKVNYLWSVMEQESPRSPHRYLPLELDLVAPGTAVLVGASNGLFALEVLARADRLCLIDSDPKWIDPLERTFRGQLDRVQVLNRLLSDCDGPSTSRLDSIFSGREEEIGYVQMDVEGMEREVLRGARSILSRPGKLGLSVCCYHAQEDEQEIGSLLRGCGFQVRTSPGYMICDLGEWKSPYLRRGVIHAWKDRLG
jgi:hypothetical protein